MFTLEVMKNLNHKKLKKTFVASENNEVDVKLHTQRQCLKSVLSILTMGVLQFTNKNKSLF